MLAIEKLNELVDSKCSCSCENSKDNSELVTQGIENLTDFL